MKSYHLFEVEPIESSSYHLLARPKEVEIDSFKRVIDLGVVEIISEDVENEKVVFKHNGNIKSLDQVLE